MYRDSPEAPARADKALADTGWVMLDPAVELLDAEVAGYRFLAHGAFETGMAIPPGEGLLDLLAEFTGTPASLATLRTTYSDAQLVDTMVGSLVDAGFAHAAARIPTDAELAELRHRVDQRCAPRWRPVIALDLDALPAIGPWRADAAELQLRCAALDGHEAALEALLGAGDPFRVELRTRDLRCSAETRRLLWQLRAALVLEDVAWPLRGHPPGLSDLVAAGLPVHIATAPARSILDREARAAAIEWMTTQRIAGLRLRLDVDSLAPASDDSLFDAVAALDDALGDVQVETLPGDAVLLGHAPRGAPPVSTRDRDFRRAWLRRRIPFLKACEGTTTWSQVPEVEDKLVRAGEDLLPNHPELLGIGPGSLVIDVCGGLGRVARRLSPAVGAQGRIVSIELLRCLSDRARRYACERGFANLEFRPGLAQRLPLPDGIADAAVNEWTGGIWELGLGPAMLAEMARVVRPGGRIAVTHRLVRIPLARLAEPWVQYDAIYEWMRAAFAHPELMLCSERIWGQVAPSMIGERANLWRKQYLPCAVDPHDFVYTREADAGAHADVYLTLIAEKRR